MDTTKSLHVVLLLATLIVGLNSMEVRVLTGLNMRGMANQPDYGNQKLTVNSNNKYVYPSQQVPEYNVYSIPPLYYSRNFLEVVSDNFVYPILLVEKRQAQYTYQLVHPFTRQIMEAVNEPIYLKPFEKKQYLIDEQPFNIMGFLFSGTGMFLMAGIFLYLCYQSVIPKMEEVQMAPPGHHQHQEHAE